MTQIIIVENDIKSLQTPMEAEMAKCIKHFEGELIKIRTGRAHTSLIEDIMISCYGQAPMPLKNLAALAAPDTRLLTIQPWDSSIIADIEKAIMTSDIGIKPITDSKVIKLVLPEMSSTRRDELVKVLKKKLEECRISVRNVRKDFNNYIRDAKKNKSVSENFFNRLEDVLQKVTDLYIKKADQMAEKKEHEITAI
jgi:ribosome recycling factor